MNVARFLCVACVILVLMLMARQPCFVQVVVARYGEDLSWLDSIPFSNVIVYDKGNTPHNAPPHVAVHKLANVGKCDHTYLHHMYTRYNQLADVTIFLPASAHADPHKRDKMLWVFSQVMQYNDSAFPQCTRHPTPLQTALYDFKLDEWKTSDRTNASINAETKLLPCPERPFGKWYAKNFPGITTHSVWYQGIFATSRKRVHNTSREGYKRLLAYVNHHSNPEAGHYIERSWAAIFKVP